MDSLSSYHKGCSCRLPIITGGTVRGVQTRVQPPPPLQSFYPDKSLQLFVSLLSDGKAHDRLPDKQLCPLRRRSLARPPARRTTPALITGRHYRYEGDVCFSIRGAAGGGRSIPPDESFIKDGRCDGLVARLERTVLGSNRAGGGPDSAPWRLQCLSYQTSGIKDTLLIQLLDF